MSVRNTRFENPITVLTVDYYDSDVKLLKTFITETAEPGPMGTFRSYYSGG